MTIHPRIVTISQMATGSNFPYTHVLSAEYFYVTKIRLLRTQSQDEMAGHYAEDDEDLGSNKRYRLRYHPKSSSTGQVLMTICVAQFDGIRFIYQLINSERMLLWRVHHARMQSCVTGARVTSLYSQQAQESVSSLLEAIRNNNVV